MEARWFRVVLPDGDASLVWALSRANALALVAAALGLDRLPAGTVARPLS